MVMMIKQKMIFQIGPNDHILERISKLRLGFLARREAAKKRSIHVVCMQVRRAGTLRFCSEPAHNAARGA